MAHSSSSRYGSFFLAGSSRTRRRIALTHYELDQASTSSLSMESAAAGPPAPDFVRAGVSEESAGLGQERTAAFAAVRQLVTRAEPLTWLLAGDRLMDPTARAQRWRSASEYLSDRLQSDLGRPLDLVVNTTQPGETSGALRKRLDLSLLQLNADVVVVSVGFADAQAGPRGLATFLHNLKQVVELIRSEGSIPVLQTPHRVGAVQAAFRSALRPYVRMIRDTARELDAPCVDHWAGWRSVERKRGSLERFLDPDQMFPSARGHAAMAHLLCAKLAESASDES